MKPYHSGKLLHIILLLPICIFFSASSIFAQSTIIGLRFNNQTVSSVKLNVMPPGKGGNQSEAKVGDQLASGTKLIIPPNTIVILQSPGGKQKLTSITGAPMEYTLEITPKGENHITQGVGAQIQNTVNQTVGYNYKVNNGKGTTAASKGTVFTFTDLSQPNNEQAKITTEEGTINIIDEIPVRIAGAPEKPNKHGGTLTKSVSRLQSQGQGQFISSNQPVNYNNYDEAISAIGSEVNSESDPDERADDLTCLGDLFMDNEQPAKAIAPFRQAAKIYEEEYGDDDLSTLEAKLSLAEALMDSDKDDEANNILSDVESILLDNLSIDLEDLDYVKEENDDEAQQIICEDITETYGLLGWLYEIKADEKKSDEYYDKMDEGCK